MINSTKLAKELINAGITTHGNCNSNGVVWDDNGEEIQDREDVQAIIQAHDPTPDPVESVEDMVDRKISEAISLTSKQFPNFPYLPSVYLNRLHSSRVQIVICTISE